MTQEEKLKQERRAYEQQQEILKLAAKRAHKRMRTRKLDLEEKLYLKRCGVEL